MWHKGVLVHLLGSVITVEATFPFALGSGPWSYFRVTRC
jgi:hypothetical protein